MSEKENKGVSGGPGASADQTVPIYQQQQYYGTFQGIPSHNQPPVVGFPQPSPLPGAAVPSATPYYYARGYQTIPVYAVAEGRLLREPRLPCCGIGIGWILFISGFFFAAIPWYVGAFIILCVRVDYREKPGLVACMVASVLAVIAVVFGVTKGSDSW